MKKFIVAILMVAVATTAVAQKVSKAASKQAKEFAKQGWLVTPGSLPLEQQFERSYQMRGQIDDMGYPKFIIAEAKTPGKSYDAAKMQALDLAKINLAGLIQTEVAALIEGNAANKQLAAEDAESVAETVQASKSLIAQSIGRVITVVECYQVNKNKTTTVYVSIAYNQKMAMEAAKSVIREELEKKGEKLHAQLDKLLAR